MDLFEYDKQEGVDLLCGVDEAGRGPLAGDVFAAAVILPKDCKIEGLNDSKKLNEKKRDLLYDIIIKEAVCYCVATASVSEIESVNILNATFLAMRRAVDGLSQKPNLALVDGNKNPGLSVHTRLIVKGDATSAAIAAASILAKVSRDRYMEQVAKEYPQYLFEKHKGYGTALHYEMLAEHGISPVHRASFLKNLSTKHGNCDNSQIHKQTAGKLGEDAACEYLKNEGYEVKLRNYSCQWGEIDVIAKKDDYIAFVEVKTRTPNGYGEPREAVSKAKRERLRKTAECYFAAFDDALQPRFDICEVYIDGKNSKSVSRIEYYENAFGDEREY